MDRRAVIRPSRRHPEPARPTAARPALAATRARLRCGAYRTPARRPVRTRSRSTSASSTFRACGSTSPRDPHPRPSHASCPPVGLLGRWVFASYPASPKWASGDQRVDEHGRSWGYWHTLRFFEERCTSVRPELRRRIVDRRRCPFPPGSFDACSVLSVVSAWTTRCGNGIPIPASARGARPSPPLRARETAPPDPTSRSAAEQESAVAEADERRVGRGSESVAEEAAGALEQSHHSRGSVPVRDADLELDPRWRSDRVQFTSSAETSFSFGTMTSAPSHVGRCSSGYRSGAPRRSTSRPRWCRRSARGARTGGSPPRRSC